MSLSKAKERERALRFCVLPPSSTVVWVAASSISSTAAMRRRLLPGPLQLKYRTQPAAPLYCNMYAFTELALFWIKCINILESNQTATNYCTHLHCLYTMLPDAKQASADKGSNATKTNWNWTAILKVWLHYTLWETDIIIYIYPHIHLSLKFSSHLSIYSSSHLAL